MTAVTRRKNPNALKDLQKRLENAKGSEIAVGFPKEKAETYDDGTLVSQVAASHVFGVGVPQRDFMALAKGEIATRTKPIMKELSKRLLSAETSKDANAVEALQNNAGMEAQTAIRQAIVDLDTPPNAPSTLHPFVGGTNPEGKKSDNPLIDTGKMRDSVTWVVRKRT